MEHVKHENVMSKESLDYAQGKADMIFELSMDSMTMNFSYRVNIGTRAWEQIEGG